MADVGGEDVTEGTDNEFGIEQASKGPHTCIDRQFALPGSTLALARLVWDFDVLQSELEDPRVTPTLRPAGGIEATVTPTS